MNSNSELLRDMDKAITEMEIALVIIKPELRSLAEWYGSKKDDKKKGHKQREKKRSHKDKEKDKGKSSAKSHPPVVPPIPSRHHSDPSINTQTRTQVNGLISGSAVLVAGHSDPTLTGNHDEFLSVPSVKVTSENVSGSSKSHHHKGIKSIFRRPSSVSRSSRPDIAAVVFSAQNTPRTPSEDTPRIPLYVPSPATHSPLVVHIPRSPSLAPQQPTPALAPPSPSQISYPFPSSPTASSLPAIFNSNSLLSESSPAVSQLSSSLFNLRQIHNALTAQLQRPFSESSSRTPVEGLADFTFPSDASTLTRQTFPDDSSWEGLPTQRERDLERATAEDAASRFARQVERAHHRSNSTSSLISNVLSVWYDAEQVVDEEDESKEDEEGGDISSDGSSEERDEFEDVDDTILPHSGSESSFPASLSTSTLTTLSGHPTELSSWGGSTADLRGSMDTTRAPTTAAPTTPKPDLKEPGPQNFEPPIAWIEYRKKLPAQTPRDEGSLISVLRKSVGKDMSQISMPVTFNEPLSLLQRAAEDVEYSNLLTLAANSIDPVERLAHVSAFAISGYAIMGRGLRSARKPCNPMLGETFELGGRPDVCPDLKFVAEKVSHHPPIIASFASSNAGGWEMQQTSSAKNKLSGMSLEITHKGLTVVRILKTGETFSWNKPLSHVRNLMGTKYFQATGSFSVYNDTTGDTCSLNFKEGGWSGSGRNVVSGVITSNGSKVAWIDGKWDSRLDVRYGSSRDPAHVLWQANEWPADADKYYGWNYFTMSLNQLDPAFEPFLPTSDSRFNPSQRYLEEGDIAAAEETKLILENQQRARNKARADKGETWQPLWFKPGPDGENWEFGGRYWEARAKQEFEDLGLFQLN